MTTYTTYKVYHARVKGGETSEPYAATAGDLLAHARRENPSALPEDVSELAESEQVVVALQALSATGYQHSIFSSLTSDDPDDWSEHKVDQFDYA